MKTQERITLPETEIAAICRKYQVRQLSLFGSAARGEMPPDSDIDLLVDYLPEACTGLIDFATMQREFSSLLGRSVDLAIKMTLKALVRPHVLRDAEVIYAA